MLISYWCSKVLATQISSHVINILQKLFQKSREWLCVILHAVSVHIIEKSNFYTILNVLQVSLIFNLTFETEVIRKF